MTAEKVTLPPSAPSYPLMLDVSRLVELVNPKDIEENNNVTAFVPLIANAFVAKNARLIFSQKVLSIFVLQTVIVNMIMETFLNLEIFKMFLHEIDIICLYTVVLVLLSISIVLMLIGMKSRRKAVINYIILVYQPIGLTITAILVWRALIGEDYFGQELLEMVCKTWKSYVFSGVAIMIYSIFCLDSKHGLSLIFSLYIASGVFTCLFFCSIFWYANKYPGAVAYSIILINLVLYPMYVYILYDIDAMTKRDYRAARDPTDYVNGAANLQLDLIFIIFNLIKVTCFRSCGKITDDRKDIEKDTTRQGRF